MRFQRYLDCFELKTVNQAISVIMVTGTESDFSSRLVLAWPVALFHIYVILLEVKGFSSVAGDPTFFIAFRFEFQCI